MRKVNGYKDSFDTERPLDSGLPILYTWSHSDPLPDSSLA